MKKIFCGISGTDGVPKTHKLSEVPCDPGLLQAIQSHYGCDLTLRPAQDEAIFGSKILTRSENVIVTTPTNSGKSLISYLLLLNHAAQGHRVVLVEPLRALAQEKFLELSEIAKTYKALGGDKVNVIVTTGDYRTTSDFLNSKPQQYKGGQIVIATPERLDAISREPSNEGWMKKISFVCVDEAHMIGDRKRGATLELLLSYLRSFEQPPRIVLMSATIANAGDLAKWLKPCVEMKAVARYPKLEKYVYAYGVEEQKDKLLLDEISATLKTEGTSILAFVGSKASAEKAAGDLVGMLGGKMPKKRDLSLAERYGVAWYHAGQQAATKQQVYEAVQSGKVRVVFATTALGMGVNLPATHVYVRDLKVGGGNDEKDLDPADILQMLGRAGRGDKSGTGIVFEKEGAGSEKLAKQLADETLPRIVSRLSPPEQRDGYWGRPREDEEYSDSLRTLLMGLLSRLGPKSVEGIETVLSRSFGGTELPDIRGVLEGLTEDSWRMVWKQEETNEYHLTKLGEKVASFYFPVRTAAGVAYLIRALFDDDLSNGKSLGSHLRLFTELDWLIVLCTASKDIKLSIFSHAKLLRMRQLLNTEMECLASRGSNGQRITSHLYSQWIKSEGNLLYDTILPENKENGDEKKTWRMSQATLTACLLFRLAQGEDMARLGDAYGCDVGELHEKLRDNCIWMLSGLIGILDSKCFYNSVKTSLESGEFASDEPIERRLKPFNQTFDGRKKGRTATGGEITPWPKLSRKIYDLIESLKYRTDLGKIIVWCKDRYPDAAQHPGDGVMRKLQEGGILSIKDLVGKKESDLMALGVEEKYAKMVIAYIVNRLR